MAKRLIWEKELNPENIRKIGRIFILALMIFLVLLLLSQGTFIKKYYPVKVRFNFIADVKIGAEVKFIGGPDIGYVAKIKRYINMIEMTLKIKKSFKMREKADISIFTHGMMGERYIEVSQTEYSGDYINPGQILTGNDPLSFEAFQKSWTRLQKDLGFFSANQSAATDDFKTILYKLQNNLYSLACHIMDFRGKAKTNINSYQANTENVINKINKMQDYIVKFSDEIKTFPKNDVKNFFLFFTKFTVEINNINDSMEKTLASTKLLGEETDLIVKRKNITGKLIYDDKSYNNLIEKLEEFESFSKNISKNPDKLFFK